MLQPLRIGGVTLLKHLFLLKSQAHDEHRRAHGGRGGDVLGLHPRLEPARVMEALLAVWTAYALVTNARPATLPG